MYDHDPLLRRDVRPRAVPLEVARQLVAERDAFAKRANQLEQALHAERAAAKRERDQAWQAADAHLAERDAAIAERDQLRARLTELAQAQRQSERPNDHAAELDQLRHRVASLQGDLTNVQRRLDERVAQAVRAERVARLAELLEVYDGLTRSLQEQADRHSPWFHGHAALLRQVRHTLDRLGVQETGRAGERFDPALHEALGAVPATHHPAGHVAVVERTGFVMADGALVRPARVLVGQ